MIQDKSNEFQDTWTFLNRRLVEAVQLHDLLSKSEVTSQSAKDTVQSVFVTVSPLLFHNVILSVPLQNTLSPKINPSPKYGFCSQ